MRWIACRPDREGHLWIAVEAGALVTIPDGGLSWHDRVPGSPRDTYELAVHRERPEQMRVAAGDGYFESNDAGATWTSPHAGLDVGYLRSVAVAPQRSGRGAGFHFIARSLRLRSGTLRWPALPA